ncbi:DUF308 domain-containing protein [Pontibacter akesuensis]|uniref:Uncharacterized protein n=1 Tax=Pontibacter akesuensis TaxID=388950 RepID=A0A1I7IJ14_9BACT|nr:DUF308 domain-containing protein [Pontibacter akesuensis]SFU72909.1 Short repeat of unknown function [Pontibacter akesuensis]
MLRPKKEQKPISAMYAKFARIFAIVMTLLYVGLGIFIIFAAESLQLEIPVTVRYMLGGILILYGIVRFVRAFKRDQTNNRRYEE